VLRYREEALRRLSFAASNCGSEQYAWAELAQATAGSHGDVMNFDFSNFIPQTPLLCDQNPDALPQRVEPYHSKGISREALRMIF
jgi:hypothetical protein